MKGIGTYLHERAARREMLERELALPPEPPVSTRAPEPVSATVHLHRNLQRTIAASTNRAEQLQRQIEAATAELADVNRAKHAASVALQALAPTPDPEPGLFDESGGGAGFSLMTTSEFEKALDTAFPTSAKN